jgi:uncharacterized protein
MSWKNGRGETRELLLWPDGARFERGDFDWRISMAGVDSAGPFSAFPGFERLLMVTGGAGLWLEHGDSHPRAHLRPQEPYRFDGAWPTFARPVSGPVTDFGVLTRQGVCHAELEVLRLGARRWRLELAGDQHAYLHVAAGQARARIAQVDDPLDLASDSGLHLPASPRGFELDLAGQGECLVFAVTIHPDGQSR